MMNHKIEKRNLFEFFQAKGIVLKETNNFIEILEKNNINKANTLKKVIISKLNPNNQYFKIFPENPTNFKPDKQTECVIIEYDKQNDFMNLIFVEMKPKKVKRKDILAKFEKTFNWLYLLFNILNGKEGKEFRVYFLLCKYSDAQKDDIFCRSKLEIFNNVTVKYTKLIKYSNGSEEIEIDLSDIINTKPNEICEEEK